MSKKPRASPTPEIDCITNAIDVLFNALWQVVSSIVVCLCRVVCLICVSSDTESQELNRK